MFDIAEYFNHKKKYEKLTVGFSDEVRRNNLLANANKMKEKTVQKGKHLSLIFGNEEIGIIEYVILNASL